jgi:hypothetical protein
MLDTKFNARNFVKKYQDYLEEKNLVYTDDQMYVEGLLVYIDLVKRKARPFTKYDTLRKIFNTKIN